MRGAASAGPGGARLRHLAPSQQVIQQESSDDFREARSGFVARTRRRSEWAENSHQLHMRSIFSARPEADVLCKSCVGCGNCSALERRPLGTLSSRRRPCSGVRTYQGTLRVRGGLQIGWSSSPVETPFQMTTTRSVSRYSGILVFRRPDFLPSSVRASPETSGSVGLRTRGQFCRPAFAIEVAFSKRPAGLSSRRVEK